MRIPTHQQTAAWCAAFALAQALSVVDSFVCFHALGGNVAHAIRKKTPVLQELPRWQGTVDVKYA